MIVSLLAGVMSYVSIGREADPPATLFRYRGQEAVGLAVGMKAGANIIDFGAALDEVMAAARASEPIGIDFHRAANQPHVVDEAVSHFLQALLAAELIVLAVGRISPDQSS